MSNPLSEQIEEPIDIAFMDRAENVIFEQGPIEYKCQCWNSIYKVHDSGCSLCSGTGIAKSGTNAYLGKAVMKTAGGMVDDEEPIAYAYTYDTTLSIGDKIVCKGFRYKVISIKDTITLSGIKVTVCGLDYEGDYNHNQADLARYK